MVLNEIQISSFRNLEKLGLVLPHQGYCIISGSNGSGKTSILEAIYTLSCGRSFRAPDLNQAIQNNHSALIVSATLSDYSLENKASSILNIGFQRDHSGKSTVKSMGKPAQMSDIARLLPIRMISPIESYLLINGAPEQRRRFLDWGMFHVKHFYWNELKKLHRILKQKNAALKMRCSNQELNEWNYILSKISYSLNDLRCEYIKKLSDIFRKYQEKMPILKHIRLDYFPGWKEESTDLFTQLSTVSAQERAQGRCLLGAHRSEIIIKNEYGLCKDQFSRGQQKTLAMVLYLAQGELLYNERGIHPIYMIDDFSSELDKEAQSLFINSLDSHHKQIIITLLDQDKVLFDKFMQNEKNSVFYSLSEGRLI